MGKFKTLATGLASTLFLFSCSSESEQGGLVDNSPKNVSVSLELPRLADSKMIGPVTTNGQKVTLSGTVMVYAKQAENGAIVNTYTLDASDFFNNGTSVTKTLEVNGTATYLFVEGNIDEGDASDDVNTRQGGATSSAVRVTGGKGITQGSGGANSTCAVELSPEMARIEVLGSLGTTTNIQNLKINGIYLNNVKKSRAAASLVKTTKDTNPSWNNSYIDGGEKSKLFTKFTTPMEQFESGKADGYNFFTQGVGTATAPQTKEEAMKSHPHIILEVSYTDSEGNNTQSNRFLNVVAFKDESGNYFQNFENGKIYQLSLADVSKIIDVPVPPVTTDPDPNAVSVDITVTVKGWDIVVAKPEV